MVLKKISPSLLLGKCEVLRNVYISIENTNEMYYSISQIPCDLISIKNKA